MKERSELYILKKHNFPTLSQKAKESLLEVFALPSCVAAF